MIAQAPTIAGFDALTLLSLAIALAVAWTNVRLMRPQRKKIVAETTHSAIEDADTLMNRYRELLTDADSDLEACRVRITDLERREQECEERNEQLAARVEHLEDVIRRHNLNGD